MNTHKFEMRHLTTTGCLCLTYITDVNNFDEAVVKAHRIYKESESKKGFRVAEYSNTSHCLNCKLFH